jgi:hypothetical protein
VLPGTVQAFVEAPIYARTSGYLKDWRTDIGTQVKRANCWRKSRPPKSISNSRQAQADLATARANESVQQHQCALEGLLATESVSKQDADEKAGDAAAKKAAADSAAANVARLRELESFKRVVAPFTASLLRATPTSAR